MQLSIATEELQDYLMWQLEYRFPDKKSSLDFKDRLNKRAFDEALERVEFCFSHVRVRGYSIENHGVRQTFFNHLNSDQYSQFLYYFSNSLWKTGGDTDICSKLILLNRDLHGCWFSYKGTFPDIFLLYHPVGSMVGHNNVKFSDYLVILQNVTINASPTPLDLGNICFWERAQK